ncbi:hypothetical protein DF3PB_10047 [uncultured Defluviicoccus sp.]|uniref:Uncharacterized protein n=1 Tax=metagenome TaxID=256318 RepID=A0A380T9G2_9ZZZZ|nr:hypothetical protein DF3PB_10047 [uncultured Defluviicoccus sp.]
MAMAMDTVRGVGRLLRIVVGVARRIDRLLVALRHLDRGARFLIRTRRGVSERRTDKRNNGQRDTRQSAQCLKEYAESHRALDSAIRTNDLAVNL